MDQFVWYLIFYKLIQFNNKNNYFFNKQFDLDQKSDPIEKTESDSESDSEPSDPDLMFQCFNTMSSVSKLGYLENELFSITLNGLFVYDLTTDDLLHKSSDLRTFLKKHVSEN